MNICIRKKMFVVLCSLCLYVGPSVFAVSEKLNVPFSSQAPGGEWVEPWNSACEETALLMVNAYYDTFEITPDTASKKIQDIITAKEEYYGKKTHDESIEMLMPLIQQTFSSWRASVHTHTTVKDLEQEIASGHPIIVPFDARSMNNPGYGTPPPTYHMVVIVGYDTDTKEFIIHDPGMTAGKDIHVTYDNLVRANSTYTLHDTNEQRGGDVLFTYPYRPLSYKISDFFAGISARIRWFFQLIFS